MKSTPIILAVCLAALGVAPAARAQISRLDKTMLIEGLRKEGMGELLEHMARTEPMGDPILKEQIIINTELIEYTNKRAAAIKEGDPAHAADLRRQAITAFDKAMSERQGLIKSLYDDVQRPLWQADLAEQQIFEYLQIIKDNANDFYEFGVPSAEQREAFETTVPQALEEMTDADLRLFHESGELPQQPDHEQKRVNTGLWDRMINQYYKLRVPYYLAHAAYYTALLPDSHPYFKNLNNPRIPQQKHTPADERSRLLALALEKLAPFTKDINDPYEVKRAATCMTARALIARGKFNDAIDLLDVLIKDGTNDRTNLLARIARAEALEGKSPGPAVLDILAETQALPLVKDNLLLRLLVVDATHRVLLHRAQAAAPDKRGAAIALAYEPYQKLLDDPDLGANADSLKDYIYRRWEASVPTGSDVSSLPGMVVAAIGEISRSRGQGLMDDAAVEKDPAKAAQLHTQGLEKLTHSIELNVALLKRTDLTPGVKAQAMFNQAVAVYYSDQRDQKNQIQCAVLLTDLADLLPDQKLSEPGIVNAVSLLHFMHQQTPRPQVVVGPYERAADVLITKFPTTKAATDERLYFANEVLEPAGKLARAVEVLRAIPAGHPDYFPAQRLMLDCLQQEYRLAHAAAEQPASTQPTTKPAVPQADPAALAAEVKAEATRIYQAARNALPQASGADATAIRHTAGWAQLVQADMAMEQDKDVNQVLAVLKDFDREYSGDDDLIRLMLEKRIVALFKADKLDDAVGEAKRMIDAFPNDAAPVVDRVLSGLDQHLEDLRYQAAKTLVDREKTVLLARADGVAKQELELARYLLEWATKQKLTEDRMVPFQLIYAKSLRLSGDPQKALTILEPLEAKNQGSADLIANTAECYFAIGAPKADKPALDKAAALYDKLINGIPIENGKYPLLWWTAWMRRLQISDITKVGTDQIGVRIRQLRNTDPNLGGETTRTTFESLGNKWSQ